jgi:hypothetical protein
MRSRQALIWILAVVGAALALPPTTLAGRPDTAYSFKIIYNYCDGTTVHFKVKNIVEGSSDANKLTIDSWAQRASQKSGPWTKVYQWDRASYKFDIDGTKHWLTSWRSYNGNNSYWFQIVFRLRAWHNKTLFASVDVPSVKC